MTDGRMELVRSLTAGFSEVEFAAFRDGLVEAADLDELARSTGSFGELMRDVLDPAIEVHLHDVNAAFMVGRDFHGWRGWLDFWRNWLEPWESYSVEFSDWDEIGETVLYRLDIEARGRGSGVEVRSHITQAWTVRDGKVTRLDMYAGRSTALADLGRG
ncbi:MAG: nuclear transport factor 2 family protein [Solirubrobacterales bacterium]